MIDALPEQWWPVAVAVTAALLDDPLAAEWATRRPPTCATAGTPPPATRCTTLRSRPRPRWCFAAAQHALERVGADRRDRRTPPRSTRRASSGGRAAPPTTCSTIGPDAPSLSPLTWSPRPRSSTSLEESRRRTLGAARAGARRRPARQVSELMSPLCWDLAHIGHYEELWLVRELDRRGAHRRRVRRRLRRVQAPPARATGARRSSTRRARARSTPPCASACSTCSTRSSSTATIRCSPTASSTAWSCSTSTSTTRRCSPPSSSWTTSRIPTPTVARRNRTAGGTTRRGPAPTCSSPAGRSRVGTDADPWAYDNERPAHVVSCPRSASTPPPVTNGAYPEFVDGGRLRRPAHWTDAGWAWRAGGRAGGAAVLAPAAPTATGSGDASAAPKPVPPDEPVQHVCWYEADAFARWSASRLPTEAEWEAAAARHARSPAPTCGTTARAGSRPRRSAPPTTS